MQQLDDERYRVEMYRDSGGLGAYLQKKVPFKASHRTHSDLVILLGEEIVRLPAYLPTLEAAEALADRIGLPDGHCVLISHGEWGPSVDLDEMEEMEMDVTEALDWCSWDAHEVVRIYVRED